MNIIITSGGTSEKIDQVRSITNNATGRLGSIIANTFLKDGHKVTLITTKLAIKPEKHKNLTIITIESVQDLMEILELHVKTADAIVHSMAVSDYTPIYMTDFKKVTNTKHLEDLLLKNNQSPKISSQSDYQVLFLKKTPKVIQYIKQWNPSIKLFGFKLLVDVSKEELIKVAQKSLLTNHADFILANDLKDITNTQHKALLISEKEITPVNTKEEIANLIRKKATQYD